MNAFAVIKLHNIIKQPDFASSTFTVKNNIFGVVSASPGFFKCGNDKRSLLFIIIPLFPLTVHFFSLAPYFDDVLGAELEEDDEFQMEF